MVPSYGSDVAPRVELGGLLAMPAAAALDEIWTRYQAANNT